MDIDPTLPEPVRRFLLAGARLESIVLDAEGRWHHEGEEFQNERLKELFHRSIDRTPGGTWVLRIPPFTYPIVVEDTPYHVRSLSFQPAGAGDGEGGAERLLLRLSDGTEEEMDPATLRYVPGRGFYCRVKGGAWEARLNRPAHNALGERLEMDEATGHPVLRLGGRRIALPGA